MPSEPSELSGLRQASRRSRFLHDYERRLRGRHSAPLLLSHGALLLRVTRNELRAKYAGSLLGFGWLIVAPLLFLTLYAAVILFVYRLQPVGLTREQYVLYIVTGLVPYLVIAESVSAGVSSVVANKSILANVVFPIDLVPAKAVLAAQPTMIVGTAIIVVGVVATDTINWTMALFPVVFVLQTMALIGATWILSLLNIVLRDLTHIMATLLLIMLVASPIAYTPDQVPSRLKWLLVINPFSYFVVAYQEIWVLGRVPTPPQIIGLLTVSFGLFFGGGWFFARAKRALLDYV